MPTLLFTRVALWACCSIGMSLNCLAGDVEPPAMRPAPSPVRIIEVPGVSGAPDALRRERVHHALSFDTDAPKPLLRSLGLTPTDCSMRLRLPTRLGSARPSANNLRLDLQAQAGMACHF